MCSALRGFVFSHKDDVNSLIHCNLHDIFQLLARRRMSSSVLDFLPPESATVFLRPTSALSFMWRRSENRAGCQEVVECWRNCRHLPAFTRRWGRVSAEPDSTCSLPLPPRHVWRKVTGNVRRVVTSVQNFRDKHVDGICAGFVPPLLRSGGMSRFPPAARKFITHRLQRRARNGSRDSYRSEGIGWVTWRLSKAWLGAEAPSMCQVYRNGALKTQGPMSQPKALDSESPNAVSALPRRWEQIGTTSGSHFTLSPLQGEEERNLWGRRRGGRGEAGGGGGGGGVCANIFCNAKQKESRVELHLKEVEIINSAADSVKSAFLVAVQLQDKWIRLQSIADEMQSEAPAESSSCWTNALVLWSASRFPVPLSHQWLHRDCRCCDDWRPFCFSQAWMLSCNTVDFTRNPYRLGEEPVKKSKTEGDWAILPSVTFKPVALSFFFYSKLPTKTRGFKLGGGATGFSWTWCQASWEGKKHVVHHTQRYSFLGEKLW